MTYAFADDDDDDDEDTRMANAFDLQEELQALQETESYTIEREHDVRSMEPGEMDGLLQRASQRALTQSKVTFAHVPCVVTTQRPSVPSPNPLKPSHLRIRLISCGVSSNARTPCLES